jgi:hypothetical protein
MTKPCLRKTYQTTAPCADCRKQAASMFVLRLADGRWRWSESRECSSCGSRLAADGGGLWPSEIRQQLLKNGVWMVVVGASPDLISFLRTTFEFSMEQLRKAKGLAPGPVFWGTHDEMELLADAFMTAGFDARAEPATSDTAPLFDVRSTVVADDR